MATRKTSTVSSSLSRPPSPERHDASAMPLVSARSNPLAQQIRRLRQRKARDESGLFLVEGLHPVGEAIAAGWQIATLAYAPQLLTSEFGWQLVESQRQCGVRCVAFQAETFASLTDKENPQGILAVVHQRPCRLEELSPLTLRWGVALVAPQDPGNVGSILRTLDAVGADGLFLLDGGVDAYHPSAVRASMGALFWKRLVSAPFQAFVAWARQQGYRLIGSSAHAETDYRALRHGERPLILVLGNEQKGLTPEQKQACDLIVAIPMRGRASSLNLAVAAGILLYQMMEAL